MVESLRSTRRQFLSASATAFGFTIVPRHVLGGAGHIAPSDRVNIAGIGAGGMGGGDIATVSKLGTNIVVLCDVDDVQGLSRHDRKGSEEHRRSDGRYARPYTRSCRHT